ncbi:MAG: hypothetical protein KJ058_09975 [Thermoanaerobaculia bacterium]|nr:hypothetical protein [Thermoanaerobaculia bacterium]
MTSTSPLLHAPAAPLRRAIRLLAAVLLAAACLGPAPAAAEGGQRPQGEDPNRHLRIPARLAEGQTIEQVYVHLRNPGAEGADDDALRARIAEVFGIRPGSAFSELLAEVALAEVRALAEVAAVELRLYSVAGGGQVALALLVTRVPEPAIAPPPTGAVATRRLGDLPKLWQDERSLVKLIVNPALGAYADRDPWVGNPGAFVGLPGQAREPAVAEAGLELGLGGVTRIGSSNAYVYGAASYVGSATFGRDVFSDDSRRTHVELEDLYAGLLVAERGSRRRFQLSVGRQKFSLNRNLLIGHVLGASNGGERAASNLSPRNAYDMTVDARLQLGEFTLQAWFADPNELPASDSRSQYAGLNFKYNDNRSVDASLTLLGVPRSEARYPLPDGTVRTREGLRAVNPRIRWSSAFRVPGLWVEAEWAHQWHEEFDMSADGGGVWLGYQRTEAAWKPAVLYRYAVFTGDDPDTATYERFDTLTGGVQRDWAQGLDMIKLATNRNLRTHRVEVSAKPLDGLELSVDYYYFTADTRNNRGGQRPLQTYGSGRLGQEITPTLQWMVGEKLYIQALATFLIPGPGLRDVLPEPTHTWQTYQISFYWFL